MIELRRLRVLPGSSYLGEMSQVRLLDAGMGRGQQWHSPTFAPIAQGPRWATASRPPTGQGKGYGP